MQEGRQRRGILQRVRTSCRTVPVLKGTEEAWTKEGCVPRRWIRAVGQSKLTQPRFLNRSGHLEALETSLVNLKRAVALLIQENPSVELTVENCIGASTSSSLLPPREPQLTLSSRTGRPSTDQECRLWQTTSSEFKRNTTTRFTQLHLSRVDFCSSTRSRRTAIGD